MAELDLWLIDAFTDVPFRGNPAGVCWLDSPVPEGWMQSLAMEMNQAETAFVTPDGDGFRLRWFTPVAEVDLCGHATLATAHYLWATERLARAAPARFQTRSGTLVARAEPDGSITLDFPATPPSPGATPAGLLEALGIAEAVVYDNRKPQPDCLVVVDSAATVRRLTPDLAGVKRLPVRGVIVTAPGDADGIDFVSRFFAPAFGVDEDPVTGSAHCTLTPFWTERLGRLELTGYQASARGGRVRVRLRGDRVDLTGRAVTVVRGRVTAPER